MKWNKLFLINIFMLLGLLLSPVHAAYYGLFETPSTTDSMAIMKTRKSDENITWLCKKTKITHKIHLRRSRYKLSKEDQSMHELSEPVNVVVASPFSVMRMTKPTSFKDMGFPTEEWLDGATITLTFKRSGAPDTLYVGMPAPEKQRPAPQIVEENGKSMFLCRGECRSFRASVPKGLPESNLIYNWYIDNELMTGRNDRWFETYSRANIEDGEHIISCDVRVGENGTPSPRAEYKIVQSTSKENCMKSVRAFPYWGVECANETDPSDFRWNETCEWGSFSWIPIENYSHFYLEAINRKVVAKKITNDPAIKNFQLVEDSEVDDEYKFFDLPLNVKAYAEEPFEGQTIYFRFIGDTVHFTTIPYIRPQVEVSPTYIDICENAFDAEKLELTAKATGFMPGTAHYVWMYSKEKDGVYEELKAPHVRNFVPSRAGFYKVKATDRVYSCESEPVEAGLKTTDCQPVEIICTGQDYVCKGTTTILKSSLEGSAYKYKWYVGRMDAQNVEDLREIQGETSSTLQAGANKEDEGYFLEVEKDGLTILSYPFHVRKLATINGNVTLDLQMFPATVCEGSIVNIKASVLTNVFDFELINGKYDYHFLKKSLYDYDYREVKYVKGASSTAILQEVASAVASYKVEVIGCNGKVRKDEPVDMVPRNDNSCNANEIYVKEDGNDDENDGRSWATAFQTLDRAIQELEAMRSTQAHANDNIAVYLAEQVYTPTSEEGFIFPSNVTVYGGYDISPVDGTASGKTRNPRTPANPDGNMTVFKVQDPNGRLVSLVDNHNIKFCGIIFDGSSLAGESTLTGRAMRIENSTVVIDSCFINGFYFKSTSDNPVTAISIEKGSGNDHSKVEIRNTTISQIKGGQVGACISVMDDCELDIWNSCFTNNSSLYKGGVTLLSHNVSPKINIYNTTFYDNQCTSPIGYYGRVLMRFVGGNPTVNIYSSTLSGRFYKEAGTLKIYNSLVECAGRCDEYVNNYPAKSKFKEATKDANETLWAKEFLANFKGTIASKLSSRGGITQVLMPSNKLEIVGQAGAPHKLTPTDQRGIQRSSISSTFGACDADYSAVIEITEHGCPDHKNTRASFKSTISGLTNAMYQWVDNYNDLPNEKSSTMKNAPIGTYWLDVKGMDASGNYVTISSNEIRVSDVCEEPGVFYVKTQDKGGSDDFAGTTWDQAFQSLEKAVAAVTKYKKENGADAAATIHVAGGEYTLQKDAGLTLGDLRNVTILGGYGSSPIKGAKRAHKRTPSDPGFETRILAHSEKGKFATFSSSNKDWRFVTVHFVGPENGINPFITMNGGSVRLDSCLVSGCWSDNNAPFMNIAETSKFIVNSCYVYSNKAANGAFLNVVNKGNKSHITICGSTFSDNTSVKNGGAVIYTANSAPSINIVNSTMFNNSCINNGFVGVETIRMSGGHPSLNVIHSTMCGPYFFEQGNVKFSNCIVEAVGNADVNGGYRQAKADLTGVSQPVSPADHEEFKTLFSNIKLGNSNTPVLTLIKELPKVNVTKASCPECSVETDQTGTQRKSDSVTPGAVEQ